MIIELMPIIMFVFLFFLLFLGIPIAFSLSFAGILFAYLFWGLQSTSLLTSAVWGVMNNFTLVAIPLFIFMSVLLEKSNIISDLYDTVHKWSGGFRGGLAIATIIVGAIIGAISGVVAAGVIGLGLIALPQMLKYKYQEKLALGTVMAGGTLGQLIPPSLNMVIYGAITGVSVTSLFAGGLGAGIFLVTMYVVYILFRSFFNKDLAPGLEKDNRATWEEKFSSLKSIILPMLLIIIMLGAIFSGAATPTEGAGVGVLGTILISLASKRLSWKKFSEAMIESLRMSGMVGWILAGAAFFSSVFSGIGGNILVSDLAQAVPGGKWGVLVFSLVFIFILGMFLETVALIMLAAPIISPLIVDYGFDPLWWAIIFMVVLQMAFLTPPFGFAIFYLKSAVGEKISISKIYKATLPFIAIQMVAVIVLIIFPDFTTWLPDFLED